MNNLNGIVLSRIERLIEESDYLSRYRSGIYSSVTLDPTGLQKLWTYLNNVGLPMQYITNAHITVMYSRSRPTREPVAKDISGYVRPKGFGLFGKGNKDEPYVLVLELISPELVKAHMEFRKMGIQPTHKEYKPHLTLVLDINRLMPGLKHLSEKKKENLMNIFNKMIPELPQKIKIQRHTVEPLRKSDRSR